VLLFELSGFSTKRSSAGSSEVVGPELAGGGKETKQAVEYSVENEAAVQPEIGVVQILDKLEEEEQTPEAASNDEGDVSEEEYFDEDDEGILEHAINASLLNDDDRKKIRRRCPGREEENKTTAQEDKGNAIRRY
jgi:hypothetical protein